MFRLLDYLMGGLALLALPFLVWWGIYQSPQSAVNLQARLEAHARAALDAGGIEWASVRMEGQRAILTGAAPSNDAVAEAARLVRRSSGPGGVIFGGVTLVENQADAAPPVSPYVWRATKTAEGRIVLSGNVPSKAIQASLIEDARLIGRSAVDDEMKLAAGAPAGNFQGIARLALSQLALLEEGEAILTDHRLVLRGETADPEIRAGIVSAMTSVAAPFRGEPMLVGEVDWRASLSGDVLTLSGQLANEGERRQMMAAAKAAFGGEVVDTMTLGGKADAAWIDGALAGLAEFAKFRAGEMAFDATAGTFLFDGEASASTLYFLQDVMARRAGQWKTVIGAEMSGSVTDLPALVSPASVDGAQMACGAQIEAALASADIRFVEGGTAIARESAPVLDQIAVIARNCGNTAVFEISAQSSVHASEVADFLAATGVPRARLTAISYSPDSAQGANQIPESGEAAVRPVEIRIVERSGE